MHFAFGVIEAGRSGIEVRMCLCRAVCRCAWNQMSFYPFVPHKISILIDLKTIEKSIYYRGILFVVSNKAPIYMFMIGM